MISSDRNEDDCAEFEAAMGALLSGECTGAEMRRLNGHLMRCPRCAHEFEALAPFRKRLLRTYGFESHRSLRRSVMRAAVALAASLVIGLALWSSVSPDPLRGDAEIAMAADSAPVAPMSFSEEVSEEEAAMEAEMFIEELSDEEVMEMAMVAES